ncbi:hypothetical protein A8F94_17490 [Bacillus sp. FJAT-27225]|uniref:hypothetical protein n=1 Tax=Bacillus sp. FJAT-27225 TaxID=1743144 RepID=UPI00080C22A9|nr:hypothetical protein [Bacillus sp. FJAT-27225]OCA84567.1 hypothetical protein A8F94_17490 [Bacillus sp. FJAT-27225]
MRLEDHEDDNLKRILSASHKRLLKDCGAYDIEKDEDFKELVFERARYAYNDALEFFSQNFLTEINSLAISKALEGIEGDTDASKI